MLPELTQDEYSAALDQTAARLVEALPIAGPPVDAIALAGAWGLTVAWDDAQQGRGRIVRLRHFSGGSPTGSILLRHDPRRERVQWATAHELGEAFAHEVFDRLRVDAREAPSGLREGVANHLAGRILLPREWFAVDARLCGWELFELKRRYSTASHELIARRMLDFEPGVIITIFDHGRRSFRKSNASRRVPGLSPREVRVWRAASETGLPASDDDRLGNARAWPIHEPDWKREILRAEWQADEARDDEACDAADYAD